MLLNNALTESYNWIIYIIKIKVIKQINRKILKLGIIGIRYNTRILPNLNICYIHNEGRKDIFLIILKKN